LPWHENTCEGCTQVRCWAVGALGVLCAVCPLRGCCAVSVWVLCACLCRYSFSAELTRVE